MPAPRRATSAATAAAPATEPPCTYCIASLGPDRLLRKLCKKFKALQRPWRSTIDARRRNASRANVRDGFGTTTCMTWAQSALHGPVFRRRVLGTPEQCRCRPRCTFGFEDPGSRERAHIWLCASDCVIIPAGRRMSWRISSHYSPSSSVPPCWGLPSPTACAARETATRHLNTTMPR